MVIWSFGEGGYQHPFRLGARSLRRRGHKGIAYWSDRGSCIARSAAPRANCTCPGFCGVGIAKASRRWRLRPPAGSSPPKVVSAPAQAALRGMEQAAAVEARAGADISRVLQAAEKAMSVSSRRAPTSQWRSHTPPLPRGDRRS
jgi:hypothetical protein